jgi:hypothetical protein
MLVDGSVSWRQHEEAANGRLLLQQGPLPCGREAPRLAHPGARGARPQGGGHAGGQRRLKQGPRSWRVLGTRSG